MIKAYPNPNPPPMAYTSTNVVPTCKKLDAKIEAMYVNEPSMIQHLKDVSLARYGPIGMNTAAVIDSNANTIFVVFKVTSESTGLR